MRKMPFQGSPPPLFPTAHTRFKKHGPRDGKGKSRRHGVRRERVQLCLRLLYIKPGLGDITDIIHQGDDFAFGHG